MTTPYGKQRRDLERRLGEIPAPPPPADLLAKIRAEIPSTLDAANTGSASKPGRPRLSPPVLRLAAALAVVAVGLAIATRVVRTKDRVGLAEVPAGGAATATAPASSVPTPAKRVLVETRPLDETVPAAAAQPDLGKRAPLENAAPSPSPIEAQTPREEPRGFEKEAAPTLADRRQMAAGRPIESAPRSPSLAESAPAAPEGDHLRALGYVSGGERRDSAVREPATLSVDDAVRSLEALPSREPSARPANEEGARLKREAEEPRRRAISVTPSTGGTAEPLDQPVGDMYFRGTGTNPFVDSAEDRLSTFALDVDTGSWSLARSYLDRDALPPAEAIRVEEFVNAQPYADPAPRRSDFTLIAEGAPSPFAPPGDYRLLRLAVKARQLDELDRRPAALIFVVDVSGSMNRENRLGLVKRSLDLLLGELRPDDRVGLVTYGSRGRVVLRPTRDLEAIRDAVAALRPEGSTNAEEGLRLAYDLAGEFYRPGASNRLILCSDGVANVGATGPESILERIGREARRGIELTTVGFGMGNYNDALMEQLADQGDGRYHYVDTLDEARRIFVDELAGTLETIARDAKVQVEFDPATVERWRLLGYENRDVADRDFRNDRVDAGEIGAGHSAVALYEIRLAPRLRSRERVATLRLRWKSAASGRVEEAALDLRARDLEPSFRRASDDLRRAAVAAEFAEMLKGSYYAREASWRTLLDEARRLEHPSVTRRMSTRRGDLATLIEQAARLAGERTLPIGSEE